MIRNALAGKPLPVYGDGKNVRDWLFVLDHCEAVRLVLERGRGGETYNIGGKSGKVKDEGVKTPCDLFRGGLPRKKGKDSHPLNFVKEPPGPQPADPLRHPKIKPD